MILKLKKKTRYIQWTIQSIKMCTFLKRKNSMASTSFVHTCKYTAIFFSAASTSIPQTSVSAKPEPCGDRISNCVDYGHDVCSNATLSRWASHNCRYFCRQCSCKFITFENVWRYLTKLWCLVEIKSFMCSTLSKRKKMIRIFSNLHFFAVFSGLMYMFLLVMICELISNEATYNMSINLFSYLQQNNWQWQTYTPSRSVNNDLVMLILYF